MIQDVMEREEEKITQVDIEVSEKDLPILLSEQMNKLTELDESIKNAIISSKKASESAKKAKEQSTTFFKRKRAIEGLQTASNHLAQAIQSGTEAQQVSFEFQTQLAEISKYLFSLGVSNIASNRFVVRELELRLKGASDEELSELAKQELLAVVRQLKEQEDLLLKIERVSKYVQEHDNFLQDQIKINRKMDTSITNLLVAKKDNKSYWMKQNKENEEIKDELNQYFIKNEKLAKQIKEHTEQLNAHHKRNLEFENKFKEIHEDLFTQRGFLQKKEKNINELQTKLKKLQNQVDSIVKKHEDSMMNIKEKFHTIDEQLILHDKKHKYITEKVEKLEVNSTKHDRLLDKQAIKIKSLEDHIELLKSELATKTNQIKTNILLGSIIFTFILSLLNLFL